MFKADDLAPVSTGIAGLDDVLGGGLPAGHMHLIEGAPGTGKTTIAMQFLLEGKRAGKRCLYLTLSESASEIEGAARSHGWSMGGIPIVEFAPEEAALDPENAYTVFHAHEVELSTTISKLLAEIENADPECLVIDSLSELRLLSPDVGRYRRQILALKSFFSGRKVTTLLLDDQTGECGGVQLESIAHGVIRLVKVPRSYGVSRRRLEIIKIRGAGFREGFHDYTVGKSGAVVFPRLISAEHHGEWPDEQIKSGLPTLDAIVGGGAERGSSILVVGPTGVGKSSLVMQYAIASALRGHRSVIYLFDGTFHSLEVGARSLGMPLTSAMDDNRLYVKQINPAEVSPGEFVQDIRREVEQEGARLVVIDSLTGLLHAMPGEVDLLLQLRELLTYLGQKGVVTFLVLAQHGSIDQMRSEIDVSYIADTVILLRYFEAHASVRRAISVLKRRGGVHETMIREFRLSSSGIEIGEPLIKFKGILSGIPEYREQDISTDAHIDVPSSGQ